MKKEDAKALAANIQEQRPSGRQAVEDVNNPRLGMIGVA